MHVFHHRPLALAMCCLALTAALAAKWSATLKLILFAAFSVVAIILLLLSCRRKQRSASLITIVLCLCAMSAALLSSYFFFDVRYANLQSYVEKNCVIEGTVLSREDSGAYYAQFRVRLEKIDEQPCRETVWLECEYPSALQTGERFSAVVTARAFEVSALYDEERIRVADGELLALVCAAPQDCRLLPEAGSSLQPLFVKMNQALSSRLKMLSGDRSGLLAALLLGNRSYLSDTTSLAFQRVGVSHLLALSGLHVSILIGFLEWLLRRLLIPKIGRAILIPTTALFYLCLTGFSVSTWRAVFMLCVLYLGFLLRADYDSFTSISTVLGVILLLTPNAVWDISLWMSFFAAGAIIVFSPGVMQGIQKLQHKYAIPNPLLKCISAAVSALAVGCVANCALMLFTSYTFGSFSWLSVPVTMLLMLPVTLILVLSALLLVFPWIPLLPDLCEWLSAAFCRTVSYFSSFENVLIPIGDPATRLALIIMTAVLIFFAVIPIKRKAVFVLLPLLSIGCIVVSATVTAFPIYDVQMHELHESADELTLYTEHGRAVAVLTTVGTGEDAYLTQKTMLENRCTELDDLVFTRYYNKMSYVISEFSSRLCVRTLHLPAPTNEWETAIAARVEQEAALYGIAVCYDAEAFMEAISNPIEK